VINQKQKPFSRSASIKTVSVSSKKRQFSTGPPTWAVFDIFGFFEFSSSFIADYSCFFCLNSYCARLRLSSKAPLQFTPASIRTFNEKLCWFVCFSVLYVEFALLGSRIAARTEKVGLAPSDNGHFRPRAPRALPTVRPRWSNSAAVILSRSMITSLINSFRATAVFAMAFSFFFAN